MERRPDWYMFERHSKETIASWVRRLHYFYFVRAWGGHANDGDEFQAGIVFKNRLDLEDKLSQLGIVPGVISKNDAQPVIGKAYPASEFETFKIAVRQFPELEQPGHSTIAGQHVYVSIGSTAIDFSVSGTADNNSYEVSEADFEVCLKIEEVFENLNWRPFKDESFERNSSCVSQVNYPEFY